VADAGAPGEVTQGKLKALGFTQDFQRGLDDCAPQIAVVVGTLVGLSFSHGRILPLLVTQLASKLSVST